MLHADAAASAAPSSVRCREPVRKLHVLLSAQAFEMRNTARVRRRRLSLAAG